MVDDPAEYPFCSMHEDMAALDRGEEPEIYPAGFLQYFPEGERAWAYIIWVRYLAWLELGQVSHYKNTPEMIALTERRVDILELSGDYAKNPPNTTAQVYGSKTFIREITGWEPAARVRPSHRGMISTQRPKRRSKRKKTERNRTDPGHRHRIEG